VRKISSLLLAIALLVLASTSAEAQRRLTGTVTGTGTNEPVNSAQILVVGTAIGTLTTDQGQFTLNVPSGAVTLRVRRVGYRSKDVPVPADQGEVRITLDKDVLQLEAQVVTGAATRISNVNAANDVAVVTGDQLSRVPTPTIENALQGKVAGAQIYANSGAPGGGMQVRLRGVTSINGASDPLYVVDGVIVGNDVLQPGTNAILGASAGSNASSQDNGVNRIADLNPNDIESIEVLKGASASAIYGSKAANGVIIITTKSGQTGRTQFNVTQRLGTFDLSNKIGARRFTLQEAIDYADGIMTPEEVTDNWNRCNGFCDHEEQMFGENELSYETAMSVRGGNTNTKFFASGLAKHDGGIQKNTGYTKQSLRLNLNQAVGSRFNVQVNSNLIHTLTRRGLSNNDNVNVTPYFVIPSTPSFFDYRPVDGIYPVNPFTSSNILQTRDRVKTPEEIYRLLGSVTATYQLLSGERQSLQLRADGGVDQYTQTNNLLSPREMHFEANDGLPGTATRQSGTTVLANASFGAVHQWYGSGWTATSSAGVQRSYSRHRSTNIVTRDLILGQENVDRGAATEVFENRDLIRGLAFYAQEEVLLLDERLLLTVGARGERSTANGDIDKFYLFPKGSVSYRVPTFSQFINELKVRAAVGQSGNQPLYVYKYSPLVGAVYAGQNTVRAGVPTAFLGQLGNPAIEPERQTEIELGTDITMWNSRASLALTGYQKTVSDLILLPVPAPSTGFTRRVINGGELRNRGIEASLGLTPIQTSLLGWISRTTFSKNVGEITELPADVPPFTVGAFGFGYGQTRIEEGESPTQIIGSDLEGNLIKMGDAMPDFNIGFANDLTVGRFRLATLVDWQSGGDLVNITQNVYDAFGTAPDVEAATVRLETNNNGSARPYIQDGGYVKLREVALSYEVPDALVSRLFGGTARTLRLELSGRNLKTWSDYPGIDPEVSNFGNQNIIRYQDLAPFPPARSFFFTVDVGF
jgi:TonB-dependent starch-binding outer membrane protein SusC